MDFPAKKLTRRGIYRCSYRRRSVQKREAYLRQFWPCLLRLWVRCNPQEPMSKVKMMSLLIASPGHSVIFGTNHWSGVIKTSTNLTVGPNDDEMELWSSKEWYELPCGRPCPCFWGRVRPQRGRPSGWGILLTSHKNVNHGYISKRREWLEGRTHLWCQSFRRVPSRHRNSRRRLWRCPCSFRPIWPSQALTSYSVRLTHVISCLSIC